MKISIIVNGRFHAYNLAEQLEKNKLSYKMISSYHTRENLSKENIKLYPWLTYLQYGLNKIGVDRLININSLKARLFESLASKEVYKQRNDIIHCFAGYAYNILKNKNRPILVLDRGSSHAKYYQRIMTEEYKKLGSNYVGDSKKMIEKQCKEYELADYIVIPSDFVYNAFIKYGVEKEKLVVIPYGVNLKGKKKAKIISDEFNVIFVGGNTTRKGLHYLIQAFSELGLKNANLNIVGKISPEVKKIAKDYKGYNFLGNISKEKLHELYSNSSIFVLASLEEGSARVVYEAMSYGLPSIVTTNTGSIIRNGKDGFIIPIRDVNALKEKILYFYENENERRRMSNNAIKYVKNFTWDEYGNRMIRFYKGIL